MWDRPRPGIEPVSPALAGRFLTTAPPGKSLDTVLFFRHRQHPRVQDRRGASCRAAGAETRQWPLGVMVVGLGEGVA